MDLGFEGPRFAGRRHEAGGPTRSEPRAHGVGEVLHARGQVVHHMPGLSWLLRPAADGLHWCIRAALTAQGFLANLDFRIWK